MDRKKISEIFKLQSGFIGFGFAFKKYLEYSRLMRNKDNRVNSGDNIGVGMSEIGENSLPLIKVKYESGSSLNKSEFSRLIMGEEGKCLGIWDRFLGERKVETNQVVESIDDLDFDKLVFNYCGLNEFDKIRVKILLRSLHDLIIGDNNRFVGDLIHFMYHSELLHNPYVVVIFRCNALEYLYRIEGLIDSILYRFFKDLVNVVGCDLSLESNQEKFFNFISFFNRVVNHNFCDINELVFFFREYYSHPVSDTLTLIGSQNGSVVSDITHTMVRNNYITFINEQPVILTRNTNENIRDWLSQLDNIQQSNIGSFISELYHYIRSFISEWCQNINIDYFYIYINNQDLPFIKFISIVVLFCTTFILFGWLNIIRYLISVQMIEYLKIKDKYPFLFNILEKSRKINYYILIIDIILMVVLYLFLYFICIDILIN